MEDIQQNPLIGLTLLNKLISEGKLSHKGKKYAINSSSRLEVRVYKESDRKKPILTCKKEQEIVAALEKYPFNGKTKIGVTECIWEYHIFTPGQAAEGKRVNVWCANSHRNGFCLR